MPGLMSRVARFRGQVDPLDSDLKKITESGVVEVPQELFALVVESTHDADSRRKIMAHLRDCLGEKTPKRWKRVYCGLLLAEKLLESGSPVLMIETAHGHHFDLLQKVSLLEHFQCEGDKPSQHLVRKKAADLRSTMVARLQDAGEEELPEDAGLSVKDSVSCCSDQSSVSTRSGSTSSSSSADSAGTASDSGNVVGTQPGLLARSMARMRGSGNPLLQNLKNITDSAVIDIPRELLNPVLEASHDKDSRKEIMQHLRSCLGEPSGAKWRRIYASLVLLEGLVEHGSSAIVEESSKGLHFDLVQQLSFLERFEYSVDCRAQNLIRRKASSLLEMISSKPRVEKSYAEGSDEAHHKSVPTGTDEAHDEPVSSAKQAQTVRSSALANASLKSIECGDLDLINEFRAKAEEPKSHLILNGIVSVGHHDDTTSESSGGEAVMPVRRRDLEQRTRKTKAQRDQASAAPIEAVVEMRPAVQASTVDLLDF